MKTMLKHKRMNAPKKDDLKDVAKEETLGTTVKGKEAKKNQLMDEAVGKMDPVEVGKDEKKPGKVDAEAEEDERSKEKVNHGSEKTEMDVKKLSKTLSSVEVEGSQSLFLSCASGGGW